MDALIGSRVACLTEFRMSILEIYVALVQSEVRGDASYSRNDECIDQAQGIVRPSATSAFRFCRLSAFEITSVH